LKKKDRHFVRNIPGPDCLSVRYEKYQAEDVKAVRNSDMRYEKECFDKMASCTICTGNLVAGHRTFWILTDF